MHIDDTELSASTFDTLEQLAELIRLRRPPMTTLGERLRQQAAVDGRSQSRSICRHAGQPDAGHLLPRPAARRRWPIADLYARSGVWIPGKSWS